MKICTFKDIENNVYKVRIETDEFSEADNKAMEDFGEPTIDIGGTFGGTAASHAGTVDMSGGYDWASTPQDFDIAVNGAAAVTVNLTTLCADEVEVLAAINAAFVVADIHDEVEAYDAGSGLIGIRTLIAGAGQSFVLSAGVADALATLGMTAAAYTGSGAPTFTIASSLQKVKTETPFAYSFDARDEDFAGAAQLSAELWATEIIARIKTEMTTLRAKSDSFTGQVCETY